MEKNIKTILVPWDFTQVAEYAIEHALRVAKIVENSITLVHITKKKSHNEEAGNKLEEFTSNFEKTRGIKLEYVVREGTIFTTINEVASEKNANLVIMGTHGMRGMQKLTGSWALKVIVGSTVPFVVVQDPPLTDDTQEHFRDIIFPIDFKLENKEKLNWANFLAKYYNSKIHMVIPNITDEILKRRVVNNLHFAKKIMGEKGIEYTIKLLDGVNSFADETIDYAQKISADLILIMTTKNIGLKDYVMGAAEQQIIANDAKIPVMCCNPREDLRKYAGFG